MRNSLLSLSIVCMMTVFSSFAHAGARHTRATEVHCLTRNIYEEARGESVEAQIYVGLITRARVNDPRWPDTYCGVVFEKKQFSWTIKKLYELDQTPIDTVAWAIASYIAQGVYDGRYRLTGDMRCARWYKRTDRKGVSEKSQRFFGTRLFPIRPFDSHTAYGLKACVVEARL